jgi:DNA-binding transcriptional regulator YiaG
MTPAQLRDTLAALGLGQSQAARLLGVDARTMRRWIAGDRDIPEPAIRLLGLLGSPLSPREYLDSL